jgi:hypothetical protein
MRNNDENMIRIKTIVVNFSFVWGIFEVLDGSSKKIIFTHFFVDLTDSTTQENSLDESGSYP